MNRAKTVVCGITACIALALVSGCATTTPPAALTYIAVKRPAGPIKAAGQKVDASHSRGGPYLLNAGFRPAADVSDYLNQAQKEGGGEVLKNADVQLRVPFAIDILLFGFQIGSDKVTAN